MTSQASGLSPSNGEARDTKILPVDPSQLGQLVINEETDSLLDDWDIDWAPDNPSITNLKLAAQQLRDTDIPVGFPTETVYGLGADATRSSAVRGIYTAKQRPSDNPLIVHIASLTQLRALLRPATRASNGTDPTSNGTTPTPNGTTNGADTDADPIPPIYHSLIRRFWPGPLTLILPLPSPSPLAPEVTASLATFGARMPRSLLALALIKLTDRPLAAPSANASTRPSPTAAEHVLHDLQGRIEIILDGGPCDVGVESTVVDGLVSPPVILRPGGVSAEELRECRGWEDVKVAYKDKAEEGRDGDGGPRAPGMKYRHYSPRARVVLFEAGTMPGQGEFSDAAARVGSERVGVIRTRVWPRACGLNLISVDGVSERDLEEADGMGLRSGKKLTNCSSTLSEHDKPMRRGLQNLLQAAAQHRIPTAQNVLLSLSPERGIIVSFSIWEVNLGPKTEDIARGLFAALRELDKKDVDIIFVEGIDDSEGDVAAAVMNRLRKAAEVKMQSGMKDIPY
ncbi:hypothetical protein W97_03055 [Coniosporium apollinis CBS 100218]|uniref:Threonylcarbamoyl-AMP synthase n=1 Tax=Coniosporium apollinis (strain CBS 100218) TaxID=1168221 RepID=R7YPK2_CONA1|nr:uncharacterized protein W97_03055 [Coniosporium apollinis CBS 100218]EON63827.1 hypothetical protein W97_03055 [Coniosporium apollinis CBS 100218]